MLANDRCTGTRVRSIASPITVTIPATSGRGAPSETTKKTNRSAVPRSAGTAHGVTTPPSKPARAHQARDRLAKQILDFYATGQEETTEFPCEDASLYEKVMESLPEGRFRGRFDIPRKMLIVFGPPTYIHEAPNVFFQEMGPWMSQWMKALGDERGMKFIGAPCCTLYCEDGKQVVRIGKSGDICFDVTESPFPEFVVEVGYSESWVDLLEDAKSWLFYTKGHVRCVILIKYTKPIDAANFKDLNQWKGEIGVYHM